MGHCEMGQKVPLRFQSWKTQLALFDRSTNPGAIDAKTDGSVIKEKLFLKVNKSVCIA